MPTIWHVLGLPSSTPAKPMMLNPYHSLSCGTSEPPNPPVSFLKTFRPVLPEIHTPLTNIVKTAHRQLQQKLQWEINMETLKMETFDG